LRANSGHLEVEYSIAEEVSKSSDCQESLTFSDFQYSTFKRNKLGWGLKGFMAHNCPEYVKTPFNCMVLNIDRKIA
jgi:hypothetical protein